MSVSTTQKTVNVLTNSFTVGAAFVKFAADFKAAVKAGTPLTEAIAIAGAALTDIVPILPLLPSVETDAQADPVDEVSTALVLGVQLYQALIS
jgi:hypothetical protein